MIHPKCGDNDYIHFYDYKIDSSENCDDGDPKHAKFYIKKNHID